MSRSMHVLGLGALAVAACAQTSQQPAPVTAPLTSAAAAESPPPSVAASAPETTEATPAADAAAGAPVSADVDGGVGAQFRACNADADCVAVPRGGCCPHGWLEAVNVGQKDAYEKASACKSTRRPICPMFMVRDTRVARCDTQVHLCTMVKP